MDRVVNYTFAVGTAGELRKGALDLSMHKSLDGLESQLGQNGLIIVPRFIGVYQGAEIIGQGQDEEVVDRVTNCSGIMEQIINKTSHMVGVLRFGVDNKVSPELIHLLYGSETIDRTTAAQALGDQFGRVAISPIGESPDFYAKDTGFIDGIVEKAGMEIKRLAFGETIDRQSYEDDIKNLLFQQVAYGFTLAEHIALKSIQKLENSSTDLMSNPVAMAGEFGGLRFLEDLFDLPTQ